MSNQEQTQIFRGDNQPPEIGIAETGGHGQHRRPAAPSDQHSLHDQTHGPADTRQLHDSRDELADLRQLHDAPGAADLRKIEDAASGPVDARHAQDARDADGAVDAQHPHDGDGPSQLRSMNDAQGPSDTNHAHDGDGPSEQRSLSDAEVLVDAILAHDAEGPSELRSISDAEGPVDARHVQDADGPSLQRQLEDALHVPAPAAQQHAHSFHDDEAPEPEANAGMVTLNSAGEVVDPDPAAAPAAPPPAKGEAQVAEPDLSFKAEQDATPWALSIHLEARIASLAESTAKVNEQLGGLEDSIKRLAKRIGK